MHYLSFFLLLFLLTLPVSTTAQVTNDLPNWSAGKLRTVKQKYRLALELYSEEASAKYPDPEKRKAMGNSLAKWLSNNKSWVQYQPTVYQIMLAVRIPRGYQSGRPKDVCIALNNALKSWEGIEKEGAGSDLTEYLEIHFDLSDEVFEQLYDSWYVDKHRAKFGLDCPRPCYECTVPPPCDDRDKDDVCDEVDECPTVPGPASNKGCPIPEPVDPDQCLREIELPDGTICVTISEARFYGNNGNSESAERLDLLILNRLAKGSFNTNGVLLKDATGTPLHKDFAGSKYVLSYLQFVADNQRQTYLFAPAAYTINENDYPSFYDKSGQAYAGIIRAANILKDTLALPRHAWLLLVQGSADKPTFSPKALVEEVHHSIFRNIPYQRFNVETSSFEAAPWAITNGTYDNDNLPNCRGGWMYDQIARNWNLMAYTDNIIPIEGHVVDRYDLKARNATAYFAIDREQLRLAAERFEATAREKYLVDNLRPGSRN